MPVPAKKLKALVDRDSKKKRPDEEDEHKHERDEHDEKGHEHDEEGEDVVDEADLERYVEEEGERVNDGKHDKQLKKLMKDFDPEENPPKWVKSKSKWTQAKEAVDPEGDGAEKYDEPYAVVAHVYKRMGGKIKGGGGED